ncbi:MAG TPA: hypothetical protein VFA96_07885 [Nocardioides sp.]|nr:hypothetical protein [Nocardioides sp.]
MLHPRRNGALVALVVSALALLVPSSALASHDLQIYKAEAHFDLSADEASTSVSCLPGDHAIDGMWRIDHADQDDYVQPLDLIAGAVDVIAAYPSSDSTYSFTFEKNAIGRAQVKVWVTCLADATQGGSHTHHFASAIKSAAGTVGVFSTGSTVVNGTDATLTRTTIPTSGLTDGNCPSNTLLITPGFQVDPSADITGGEAVPGMMRLYSSHGSNAKTTWQWKFENSALPTGTSVTIHFFYRCLNIKVPTGGFDKHKLVTKNRSSTFNPDPNAVSEGRLNCGDAYKAILAGFDIPENTGPGADKPTSDYQGTGLFPASSLSGFHSAFNDVYYLGMDPRIKQRAYTFGNRGGTATWPIALTALCINYRTT